MARQRFRIHRSSPLVALPFAISAADWVNKPAFQTYYGDMGDAKGPQSLKEFKERGQPGDAPAVIKWIKEINWNDDLVLGLDRGSVG
eukprot:6066429-Amphidinium_carterae.1